MGAFPHELPAGEGPSTQESLRCHCQTDRLVEPMQLPHELVLRTARLQLRPIQAGDSALLWPDIADTEVARYMAWEPHSTLAQTAAFVEYEIARLTAGEGCTWLILQDGGFRGIVSLIAMMGTHRTLTYDRAELAYWLGTAHHRQGLASEAVGRVIEFAFRDIGLHKLHVSHFGPNVASRNLIIRLGFRCVGVQQQEFRKDAVWYDHHLYEMLNEDYAGTGAARMGLAAHET
jgi:ribosomal-protein-alanine N-acetyltransferase